MDSLLNPLIRSPPPPPPPEPSNSIAIMPLVVALFILVVASLGLVTLHYLAFQLCSSRRVSTSTSTTTTVSPREDELATRGVDSKTLESIPVHVYTRKRGGEGGGGGGTDRAGPAECAVCLGEFEEHDDVRVLPNCLHVFHVQCIDTWFVSQSSCPLCRSSVMVSELSIAVHINIGGGGEGSSRRS